MYDTFGKNNVKMYSCYQLDRSQLLKKNRSHKSLLRVCVFLGLIFPNGCMLMSLPYKIASMTDIDIPLFFSLSLLCNVLGRFEFFFFQAESLNIIVIFIRRANEVKSLQRVEYYVSTLYHELNQHSWPGARLFADD